MADQQTDLAKRTGSEDPAFANVQDSTGTLQSLPIEQVPAALQTGQFSLADPGDVQEFKTQEKYGGIGQQAIGTAEASGRAASFGTSTALEKGLGVTEEDILGREQALNPALNLIGSGVGLAASSVIPVVGEENVIGGIAKGASEAFGVGGEGAGIISNGISGAIHGATAGAVLQGGDKISHMIANQPSQSFESAAANVGLASVLGAGFGGALGTVSSLFEKASSSGVGKFIQDFKSRINEGLNGGDPVQNLTNELGTYHKDTLAAADEVYGPEGLKKQAIDKLSPEMSPNITNQAFDFNQQLSSVVETMENNPKKYPEYLSEKLKEINDNYANELSGSKTSGDIFDATNKTKQMLQELVRDSYDNPVRQIDPEYSFVNDVKGIASDFKDGLENTDVWGKAGKVQSEINQAWRDFDPALKDFNSKFTEKVLGNRDISPGKVNTYYNGAIKGAPGVSTRQTMLGNFIEAAEKYRNTIGDTYQKIEQNSPIPQSSLNNAMASLKKPTAGARFADVFIKKGLADLAGKGAGAITGLGGGAIFGHPYVGALIGEHALSPFFESVLPSLIKPILTTESSGIGAKSAVDYGMNIAKSEKVAESSSKNLFKNMRDVVPTTLLSKEKDLEKLDKKLKEINKSPEALLNTGGSIGHYLPGHATAAGAFAANATNYLESQRPKTVKNSPLDSEQPLTKAQISDWDRTLSIAQSPITVLQHIKDGTLLPSDLQTLKTIYPSYYASLSQKITNAMIDHISKDEKIPYSMKQSLSLFMGEPLETTLTPSSIQAAQMVFVAKQQAQQQTSNVKRGTNKLGEVSSQYRTADQSRQDRQNDV